MSFQAVTWAIEQRAGSPSAKATLWSLANYANEQWCAWPSQKTICDESEQSPDAVQKRLPELEARGLIRRIPLRFAGRKTVDFCILAPSPFFKADPSEIEPLLPRGCSIDPRHAAADSGNATAPDAPQKPTGSSRDVAANSGNAPLPQTLPQVAADVAALERQQEPESEPKEEPRERENARARTEERRRLRKECLKRYPTAAVDSHASFDREWDKLPDDQLQPAVDGIPAFIAELKRLKRTHVPSLATYIAERKWIGLAPLETPTPSEFVTFKVWSRQWWAMIFAMADRGEAIGFRVDYAKEHGSRETSERVDRMPSPDMIASLKAVPGNGDWMAAWRPWFDWRRARLPIWRDPVWVFLPGPAPPLGGKVFSATGPPQPTMTEEDHEELARLTEIRKG